MKYLFIFLCFEILFSYKSNLNAQALKIRGGVNHANIHISGSDYINNDLIQPNIGFQVGSILEFSLFKWMDVETGIILQNRGYKLYIVSMAEDHIRSLNLYYIALPIHARKSFNIKGINMYTLLGPYFGIGFYGEKTNKNKWLGESYEYSKKIEWGSGTRLENDLERVDYGLDFGLGISLNRFNIGLEYKLGLANIYPDEPYDRNYRNRVTGLSVDYIL